MGSDEVDPAGPSGGRVPGPTHEGMPAKPADPPTVLIVDDASDARALLTQLFDLEAITVVGEATDGAQAIELACRLAPDVVLMDLHMPHVDGVAASTAILELCPATQVVVLTSHPEDRVERFLREAGVFAYLNKSTSWEEVCATVRRATEVKRALDARWSRGRGPSGRGPAGPAGPAPSIDIVPFR